MGEAGEPRPAKRELDGTRWVLVELGGPPADEGQVGAAVPYFELDLAAARVSGSGGCNRLAGSVELDGDSLAFGPLATTRIACAEDVRERERRFLQALGAARAYHLDGDMLELSDGADVVARFVAEAAGESPPASAADA
jgi:heat shock protein HslJ